MVFSDNRGKTSIGTRNQRNLVVYKDVYLKISNKLCLHYFSGNIFSLFPYRYIQNKL